MQHFSLKPYLPWIIIFGVFIITSILYFTPVLEGRVMQSADALGPIGATREVVNYHNQTGDYSFWTNSMFSGMPNYAVGGGAPALIDTYLKPLVWIVRLSTRNPIFIFFGYLLAFFLLLRTFKVDKWLAMAGAFAIAMSSYFFVIIAANHWGKCFSITWMMFVVMGFLLIYRKQYIWGAIMVMFFTFAGFFLHPQMSYYICMMIGVFACTEIYIAWRSKEWKHFGIATAVFAIAFVIGFGMGSANYFSNKEYLDQTMRGGHSEVETSATSNPHGLDFDYATAWSEGIDESLTFLIPNYMGGASGYDLGPNSYLESELRSLGVQPSMAKRFCQSTPTYWGEKAFTSGPVYLGAIICFLFILALLVTKGPYKWALLVATLFSLLLSWGHNFRPLTELFYNYFPMYNKFRAVESILIVAEITVPILAFLGLKVISEKGIDWKVLKRDIFIAGGITGGLCLLIALVSGMIDTTSSYDASWKNQVGERIYDVILTQRQHLISADAWRSLVFVLLGVGSVYLYAKKLYTGISTSKTHITFTCVLTLLILVDMWPVDKRFCNDSCFVSLHEREQYEKMYPYERQLLTDDTTYYRVLNLSTNTFNESRTSLYLNSIGGYSAAKLRRYQDLIEYHISKMDVNVLNMLNTKYIIVRQKDNNQIGLQINTGAMGPCWFVDSVQYVSNAPDESNALYTLNVPHCAVIDTSFEANKSILSASITPSSEKDTIEYLEHTPKMIKYYSTTTTDRLAVFSEIYYPYGWHVTIDDNPNIIRPLRVNYMLRALVVPAGQHTITFTFDPEAIHKGNRISLICLGVFLLTLIGALYSLIRHRPKVS